MILAIETATPVCSVALLNKQGNIIEKKEAGKGIHSERLFQFIEQLMHEQGFTAGEIGKLLISKGPGQFTGLRIGAACAKGFLFSCEIEFYTIGTLEGIAAGVLHEQKVSDKIQKVVHTVLAARRNHLFYQQFKQSVDQIEKTRPELLEIEQIIQKINPGDIVAGTGYERLKLAGKGEVRFMGMDVISAGNLIRCLQNERFSTWLIDTDPSEFEPQYLTEGQVSRC